MNFTRELSVFYSSSVGKKLLMCLTGLFLLSFLCIHLYVNLFLFKGDSGGTYDAYAEFMATYPLIRPVEIALFLGFLFHALIGVLLWLKNRSVRPIGYALNNIGVKTAFSSRWTIVTGPAIFIFLAIHINEFFVKSRFTDPGGSMRDRVAGAFGNPWIAGFYLLALLFLGFHLKHGFQSAFQTMGLRHPKYRALIEFAAIAFWLLFPLLFAAIPVYFLCLGKGCA